MVALNNCTVDVTTQTNVIGWYTYKYLHNVTITGGQSANFSALAASDDAVAVMAGMVGTKTSTTDAIGLVFVGNALLGYNVQRSGSTVHGNHGRIIYNNRLRYALYQKLTTSEVLLDGLANVQNLYDYDASSGSACMNFFADTDLTNVTNYVEMHNTAVGERCSRMYNDNTSTRVVPNGLIKLGVSKFNVWDNYNIKADNFSGGGVGSVGSWAYSYSVGNMGNVSLFGEVGRLATTLPTNDAQDNYLGESWLSSSQPNLFRTSLGFTQSQIMAMFTNYLAGPKAGPAEGGNYIPLGTASHIKGRVPVNLSVLKKDLAGTTRRTDGTGAAGAYESA